MAYGGAVGITASARTETAFIDSTFTSNSVTSDDAGTPSKNVHARVRAGGRHFAVTLFVSRVTMYYE